MKIVFDAFWWVKGPPSLRHVLRETVLQWHRAYPQDQLTLVVRRKHLADARADAPPGVRVRGARLYPQALLSTLACAWVALREKSDVVYVQNFSAPSRRVSAVFLHDVLYLTNPEWFTRVERAYFRLMPALVGLADVVMTSSETEADRIRRHTRARRVVPVGIGMSEELLSAAPRRPEIGVAPGEYLLTVGRLNIRKNLAVTIEAAVASGVLRREQPLLVVGSADGKSEALSERARDAVETGLVRFTGYVDDAELVWLYENTALFLFLTRGEGFGMPAVEARHFGAPMLVSDIAVFREIVDEDVPRVDPTDPSAIAEAVRTLLGDGSPARVSQAASGVPRWSGSVERMRAAVVEAARDRGLEVT